MRVNAACQWYKASIGPRLKPNIRRVYETWAGLAENELFAHLYRIVSTLTTFAPMQVSIAKLNKSTSETKHGYTVITLASENGSFYCQASQLFLSIPKS